MSLSKALVFEASVILCNPVSPTATRVESLCAKLMYLPENDAEVRKKSLRFSLVLGTKMKSVNRTLFKMFYNTH